MKTLMIFAALIAISLTASAQSPQIEPGVPLELAKWRAARYSDVRYKLNLTLEKMSPVLKGTIEIRVRVGEKGSAGEKESVPPAVAGGIVPIVLDWRKIKGHEDRSTISNVSINGKALKAPPATAGGTDMSFAEENEHLIFRDGVVEGENVIKLDFTSPILPSGSAITRYVDKEDGSEYIYSLFVPSDASTAFPVFDQPDLKARFTLRTYVPIAGGGSNWITVSNSAVISRSIGSRYGLDENYRDDFASVRTDFEETKPISTYVFAFAAGPWEKVGAGTLLSPRASLRRPQELSPQESFTRKETLSFLTSGKGFGGGTADEDKSVLAPAIYVRKSQAAKFKPHAAEVFRLNREAVKYFEQYFDYKFPFPKYDLVLIPEFPFGGMEHAGATFLRESAIIFPQEPTRNDLVSRATLIFHEAAHQWFGDTVTMRWFDDLWLKEGFATFTAYKALEKIMPEMNAWKVFYERIKQGAYQTDATKGTTAIYQPIANLSAAKSAYGNIVYNKAPAFLRQAEFYLGEDKFQSAVRAFLKKHEFGNAGWEDLVTEFEGASGKELDKWADGWVKTRGGPVIRTPIYRYKTRELSQDAIDFEQYSAPFTGWQFETIVYWRDETGNDHQTVVESERAGRLSLIERSDSSILFAFPNYGDYGYGIFLLDEKSRDYVLKNIQNEKDPFLRAMMWGALWDSVREGELDPRVFVELVVKVLSSAGVTTPSAQSGGHPSLNKERSEDESTVATLLGRTGTALNYYMSVPPAVAGGDRETAGVKAPPATAGGTDKTADLRSRVEDMLTERMRNAPSLGQRITYYRAFLNIAASEKAQGVLKELLQESVPPAVAGGDRARAAKAPPTTVGGTDKSIPLKTKDKFDIVTRLLILGDPDAAKLLADLERSETSDDAKRYAYAARAGIGTAENKAKYWNDFVNNKDISESWIEAAFGPWNSIRHSELTLPYLQKALQELPNHKRNRKIFFVNGWLGAFLAGQRSEEALGVVSKFLADNPKLDNDLRLKILENVDVIERAVRIRGKN